MVTPSSSPMQALSSPFLSFSILCHLTKEPGDLCSCRGGVRKALLPSSSPLTPSKSQSSSQLVRWKSSTRVCPGHVCAHVSATFQDLFRASSPESLPLVVLGQLVQWVLQTGRGGWGNGSTDRAPGRAMEGSPEGQLLEPKGWKGLPGPVLPTLCIQMRELRLSGKRFSYDLSMDGRSDLLKVT